MSLSLCSSSVDNTGEIACDASKGVLRKIFIFNGTFSSADYADEATFFAKMVTNSKLSKSDSNKIFVISEVQDISRNSESNTEGTLNLGYKAVIREGRPAYKGKIFAGADTLSRLRTFNNQTIRILEYDANGKVWLTKSGTNGIGYQAKLFFSGGEIATGQNIEEGVVEVEVSILSNTEYKDNPKYVTIPSTSSIEDVKALIDVPMAEVSHSTNVWQISMKIPGSSLVSDYNIYDSYMDAIDALTFTAGTGTNYGTSLAITSVVKNASLKCLTVTFDSTAYTALTGGTVIKLIPPTPATLDAADITGIEILPVLLTK